MNSGIQIDGNYLADLEHKAASYRDARRAAEAHAIKLLGMREPGRVDLFKLIDQMAAEIRRLRRHTITADEFTVDQAHGE